MREADGTYSMAEIAPVVRIPESTLYRWRCFGQLLTTYDYLVDAKLKARIDAGTLAAMPVARFDLEDVTRLLVVGDLGMLGWDRRRLLQILARPFAVPRAVRGDGHTPTDERIMPGYLLIFVKGNQLARKAVDVVEEVTEELQRYPAAMVISLDSFRDHARAALAKVELQREREAERIAKQKELVMV